MGGGSTIAAAEYVGYTSEGVEIDEHYYNLAVNAIPLLANIYREVDTVLETQTVDPIGQHVPTISPTLVRSTSASSASLSWEIPRSLRN